MYLEVAQFIRSYRGNPHLLDSRGYRYFKTSDYTSKRNPGQVKSYWECCARAKLQCEARAVTDRGYITNYVKDHNHMPIVDKIIANCGN